MPINLFDCLFVAVLVTGLILGRKHGFTRELLPALKWLVLLVGCAVVYRPLGDLIAAAGLFDPLSAYFFTYLGAGLGILLGFSILQRKLAPRLEGSDAFGRGEYYLGMGSGVVRAASIAAIVLALLNARAFSPTEVRAMERFQEQNYGSNFFPTLHSLQVAVFERSLIGAGVKNHLGFLLISPTRPGETAPEPPNAGPSRLR